MFGYFDNFDGGHFDNRPYWQFRPHRSRVIRLIMTREMSQNKMVQLMEGPGGGGGGFTVNPLGSWIITSCP